MYRHLSSALRPCGPAAPGAVALFVACGAVAGVTGCSGASDLEVGWVDGSGRAIAGDGAFRLRWEQRLSPEYEGPYSPVERAAAVLDPARNRVYVGSTGGMLYALTPAGRRLYRYDAGGAIESQPALDAARDELYVGTEQGVLHALRASTGELRWRDRAGGPLRRPPLVHGDAVYVVSDADVVTAFARDDGEILWAYRREAPEGFSITDHAGLTLTAGKLVTAFTDGVVVALDPRSGAVVWERDTSVDVEAEEQGRPRFVDVDTTPVVAGGKLWVASFAAGLYALDPESGTVVGHDASRQGIVGLAADDERLFLASADDGIVCLSLEGERVIWRRALTRGSPTQPTLAGGAVLVGESRGSFLALGVRSGQELARFDAGHGFSAPATTAAGLGFVVSNGGSLFAFSVL